MYRCRECRRTFEYPDYVEICLEDEYGVGGLFPNRHYVTAVQCPYCGEPIYEEEDQIDEDEEEEEYDEE